MIQKYFYIISLFEQISQVTWDFLIYLLIFQFQVEIELFVINFGFKDQWLKTHIIKAKTQARTNT
jgi:hypothetical protein